MAAHIVSHWRRHSWQTDLFLEYSHREFSQHCGHQVTGQLSVESLVRVPSIRENQGESGKKIFFWKVREFCWESGKVGEFCSDWSEPSFNLDLNALFLQTRCLPGFFASLRSAFESKICTSKSGKVREKPHGEVRDFFLSWLLVTLFSVITPFTC